MPRSKRQAFAGVKTRDLTSKDQEDIVKTPAFNSVADDHVDYSRNGHHADVSATGPIADADDHTGLVVIDHSLDVSTSASSSIASDQSAHVEKDQYRPVADAIELIYEHCRRVMFARKQRIRIHNALGALIRLQLGWSPNLPEAESKAIKNKAAKLIAAGGGEWAELVFVTNKASLHFDILEKDNIKKLRELAQGFQVWSDFGDGVLGFGAASLGIIIGVAGNLSNYPDKGKLWKRLGLAVIDGNRQGSPGSGATADDWIKHGYNRQRRSLIWQIGDTMLKAQVRKVKDDDGEDTGERYAKGRYGEIYLARKQYEIGRVSLTKKGEPNKKHAHLRAQRYMEKTLIRDLWRAWRQVMPSAPC